MENRYDKEWKNRRSDLALFLSKNDNKLPRRYAGVKRHEWEGGTFEPNDNQKTEHSLHLWIGRQRSACKKGKDTDRWKWDSLMELDIDVSMTARADKNRKESHGQAKIVTPDDSSADEVQEDEEENNDQMDEEVAEEDELTIISAQLLSNNPKTVKSVLIDLLYDDFFVGSLPEAEVGPHHCRIVAAVLRHHQCNKIVGFGLSILHEFFVQYAGKQSEKAVVSLRSIDADKKLCAIMYGFTPESVAHTMGLLKVIIADSKGRAKALCNGKFDMEVGGRDFGRISGLNMIAACMKKHRCWCECGRYHWGNGTARASGSCSRYLRLGNKVQTAAVVLLEALAKHGLLGPIFKSNCSMELAYINRATKDEKPPLYHRTRTICDAFFGRSVPEPT